ncbi:hypothetical protein JOQ06_019394 [Pogonophryne albipinna]|uniref:Uncharacterized protein n=1 Tax=Pogonophryne albipinna TaxID=1090488 RepID=A0AAD6FDZ3_9TELE|nr:hypothetical protein JOQ06_019394 [Pogonophryne albipinna]
MWTADVASDIFCWSKGTIDVSTVALCVLAGVLCLASVRWSAVATISTFKYPSMTAGMKREVGSSIYVGWASSMLLLLGGAVMCCVSGERNPSSYSNAASSTDTQSLLFYVIEPDVRLFDAAAILPERNSLNIILSCGALCHFTSKFLLTC